jgi:hypothetical protein
MLIFFSSSLQDHDTRPLTFYIPGSDSTGVYTRKLEKEKNTTKGLSNDVDGRERPSHEIHT